MGLKQNRGEVAPHSSGLDQQGEWDAEQDQAPGPAEY